MALTSSFDYALQDDGSKILITDTTTYGDGTTDPSRAQSLVNYKVTKFTSVGSEDITPSYNENSVSNILASLNADGWVRIEQTITKNSEGDWAGDDFSYQRIINFIAKERLNKSLSEYGADLILKKSFGCECSDKLLEYYCIKAQTDIGIPELVRRNDMLSAQMAIERLEQSLNLLKKDCEC